MTTIFALHRAELAFLGYRVRGNAWQVGMTIINLALQHRRKGLWITKEVEAALATVHYLKVPALRKAIRKLEQFNVIRCETWVGIGWYEVRPHTEWRRLMTSKQWWRWARATISLRITARKLNPARIGAYQHEWKEVAGSTMSQYSRPVRRVGRRLFITCDNIPCRNWLHQNRALIAKRLKVKFFEVATLELSVSAQG